MAVIKEKPNDGLTGEKNKKIASIMVMSCMCGAVLVTQKDQFLTEDLLRRRGK